MVEGVEGAPYARGGLSGRGWTARLAGGRRGSRRVDGGLARVCGRRYGGASDKRGGRGAGLEGGGFGVGAPFGAEGAADLAEGGLGAGRVEHRRDQVLIFGAGRGE